MSSKEESLRTEDAIKAHECVEYYLNTLRDYMRLKSRDGYEQHAQNQKMRSAAKHAISAIAEHMPT